MSRLEKHGEAEIVRYVEEELGGECLKLKLDGRTGFPDRTIILPNCVPIFVEFKKPGGKLRSAQVKWKKRLEELSGYVGKYFLVETDEESINKFKERLRYRYNHEI